MNDFDEKAPKLTAVVKWSEASELRHNAHHPRLWFRAEHIDGCFRDTTPERIGIQTNGSEFVYEKHHFLMVFCAEERDGLCEEKKKS